MKKNVDPSGELPPIWTDATDHGKTPDNDQKSGRDHPEEKK